MTFLSASTFSSFVALYATFAWLNAGSQHPSQAFKRRKGVRFSGDFSNSLNSLSRYWFCLRPGCCPSALAYIAYCKVNSHRP
jgi:hypothetical protein